MHTACDVLHEPVAFIIRCPIPPLPLHSKDRPFSRIMDTAREVLREALPIKCIEAVFLGALLTAGWEGVHRMPLRFKSMVNGQTYK